MKKWIARSFGLCALGAAFFAPVVKAEAPAAATASVQSCTLVACSQTLYCCNHCGRNQICASGYVDAETER